MANVLNPERVCPECGEPFTATHGRQVFCAPAHKATFNNLMKARGQIITALAQTWRTSKRGASDDTTYAFKEMCSYLDACNVEDARTGRNVGLIVSAKREACWRAADVG